MFQNAHIAVADASIWVQVALVVIIDDDNDINHFWVNFDDKLN